MLVEDAEPEGGEEAQARRLAQLEKLLEPPVFDELELQEQLQDLNNMLTEFEQEQRNQDELLANMAHLVAMGDGKRVHPRAAEWGIDLTTTAS